MANTHLTRTVSSGADLTKWTWSCWVKRTDLVGGGNNYQRLISNEVSGNSKAWYIRFQSSTQFHGWSENGAFEFTTNGKYRDINGWYNLVVKYDSTQSTQSNRLKVFVNGEEPSMSAITYPSLNQICNFMNSGNYVDIGYYRQGSSEYFHGLMSHMHFTAGYAYDASSFGSTDATTGEWKINTSPSVTYGSQGFFILKDGNSVTDQSGNSNNFTVVNSLSKTEDSPSNVFATMNNLQLNYSGTKTYLAAGNTMVIPASDGAYNYAMSTIAMPKGNGKYYFEMKYYPWDYVETAVGIVNMDYASDIFHQNRQIITAANNTEIGRALVTSDGHAITSGTANSSYGFGGWSSGDIICMACDMENGAFYFRKNGGSWANSGDPTSGATKTGAIDISSTSAWTESSHWGIWCGDNSTGGSNRLSFNFGNGNFPYIASGGGASALIGVNAVSTAGTNASGNGIFEYDVPTGYTALSTKGLNL